MKLKFIAVFLGLMMAIPGAIMAQNNTQNSYDQAPDQNAKPSPYVQAPAQSPAPGPNNQGPNDQGPADQNSMDQDQDTMNPGQMGGPNDLNSANPDSNNADPNNPGAPTSNLPAPQETNGVARISLIHGDVSTQRGDSGAWSAAALNAPVLAGDKVSTGDKARTEVQLDYANMLRLAEHTQANIVQLTHSQIQIQLGHGMANF
ncbi:MAG: hypothetical protein WBW12_20260, partial [Terriglobales bacterium]